MVCLFFILSFCVLYGYFIYPFFMWALVAFLPFKSVKKDEMPHGLPSMSLIITAHNEATRIVDKLENTLRAEYPRDLLEIIVASDCSSDATDALVLSYADKNVTLVRADQRLGKEYAQSLAIQKASGDIIVFSDVATMIEPDGLRRMAEAFNDASVGAVSSEDRFISQDGSVAGEGLYVRYEMWLRQLESKVNSIVGLSGSFFAARKNVANYNWDIYSPSDFNTALNCAKLGLKAVSSPNVYGYYKDVADAKKEYDRKVRTVIRGITGLLRQREVLNPLKFGFFSFQIWSHKVMRWLEPWLMLLLFVVNLLLLDTGLLFQLTFLAQLAFYMVALAAHYDPLLREHTFIRLIYFFCQVNTAMAHALLKYFTGTRMTVWTPSKR